MLDGATLRMIDANANRAREALRVMEDYARFALNDAECSLQAKQLRHELAAALADLKIADAIVMRDTRGDVGTDIKTETEGKRQTLGTVVIAAGKRLSEALRVIEETAKMQSPSAARAVEKLRYRGYEIEKTLSRFAGNEGARERFAQVRLCVLLTEKLCHPAAGGWEKTLDGVLRAGGAEGKEICVQLREKELPDAELLRRAKIVAGRCRGAGAVSIINDRPDIALLADADGVHLGQTDLPCAEARKILGLSRIVGVSTGAMEEARQAVADGATYVAAGPMFCTTTKHKPRIAGPAYAAELVRELSVPIVAIGGIKPENLAALTALGLRTIAVCAAVIGESDPQAACEQFLAALRMNPHA